MLRKFFIVNLILSLAFASIAEGKNSYNQAQSTKHENKDTTTHSTNDSRLEAFTIISDDVLFLPNANRYIYSTDKLLNNNHQYKSDAGKILNQIVPLAKKARIVNIYGFTNEALQGPIGVKISEEQAQRIADYLWSQGISLDKMNIRGMGFQEPRIHASNDVEQHFFNNRIEIDLIP